MNNKSVAVFLPVYKNDSPERLDAAIYSIKNQDFGIQNINIYIGQDGPLGVEHNNVLKKYSHIIYKHVKNDNNLGLASILNKMFDSMEGEIFIIRQDADDISLKYRISTQVSYLTNNPNISVLGGGIIEVNEFGHELGNRNYPLSNYECLNTMPKGAPFAHPTICLNMKALGRDFRYVDVKWNEDIATWFELARNEHAFANLSIPLVKFLITDSTIARRGPKKALYEFLTYLKGIYLLFGISPKILYPTARLLFRLTPVEMRKILYKNHGLRNRLLGGGFK